MSLSLLPWTRKVLYRHIKLTHHTSYKLFVNLVTSECGAKVAPLVHQLEIVCVRGWPEDVLRNEDRSRAFWLALTGMETLRIGNSPGTEHELSLLRLSTTRQLRSLRSFSLRSELGAFASPFDPQVWRNLFVVAPNICAIYIDAQRAYTGTPVSGDGSKMLPLARHIACSVRHFTLTGHLSKAPLEAAKLINSFEHLTSLEVIDRHTEGSDTNAVVDRIQQPRLVELRIQSFGPGRFRLCLRDYFMLNKLLLDLPIDQRTCPDGLPPSLVHLDIAGRGTPALLVRIMLSRSTTLPLLRSIAASSFAHDPVGRGRVGKQIHRDGTLVLRTDKDGNPMFRPHPDWVVPTFWSSKDRRQDLENVRAVSCDMGVQMRGSLLLPLMAVEMWDKELALCKQLETRWLDGERFSWEAGAADPEWDNFL